MIGFSVDIPNERQILLRLTQLPIALRSQLLPTITSLAERLLSRVQAAEPVRTGGLRGATHMFVDQGENFIRGRVRILGRPGSGRGAHNVAAAALEYGVKRSISVRAHLMRLEHVFARVGDRRLVMVEAYQRRTSISPRRFLRDPAASLRGAAKREIETAINQALQGVL